MNVSHYQNLLVSLSEIQIYAWVSTENHRLLKCPHYWAPCSQQTLEKCSWYHFFTLKIVAFGRVQLCRDKDWTSFCLAKTPNVTVNSLSSAGLGFFYSETNTEAKLWDCYQSSHHNRQGQGQVHKIHQTEVMRLDLTLLPPMKGWCADSLQNTRDFDGAKYTVSRDKGKP